MITTQEHIFSEDSAQKPNIVGNEINVELWIFVSHCLCFSYVHIISTQLSYFFKYRIMFTQSKVGA